MGRSSSSEEEDENEESLEHIKTVRDKRSTN